MRKTPLRVQDFVLEEREWHGGIEVVSHVNHSLLARVRNSRALKLRLQFGARNWPATPLRRRALWELPPTTV